ncbi:hypothetical protein D3C81_1407110 [compost metagenome]
MREEVEEKINSFLTVARLTGWNFNKVIVGESSKTTMVKEGNNILLWLHYKTGKFRNFNVHSLNGNSIAYPHYNTYNEEDVDLVIEQIIGWL